MYGVVNGIYYCQQNRVNELNRRISSRNVPSNVLPPVFEARPVPTRYVKMPAIDCRIQPKVQIENQSHNYSPYTTFNPGDSAP